MNGNFFPPTLLADVPNNAEVMQEESFGPILPAPRGQMRSAEPMVTFGSQQVAA